MDEYLELRNAKAPSPSILLTHPRGSEHIGNIAIFAGDTATRRVLEPEDDYHFAALTLQADDDAFDACMGEMGWVQNLKKLT